MIAFVIASHGRMKIVLQNIYHLLTMGEVFIVISEEEEYQKIISLFSGFPVHAYLVNNNPLGNKWQIGVNKAVSFNPSILITCGSDDFLSINYIDNATKLLDKGFDFIGVNGWYMSDGKHHYKAKYKHRKDFPAGSGRVFTKKCLDTIWWDIFDRKADRLLDDKALLKLKEHKIKTYISQDSEKDGLKVLALKGKWECLNPLEKFLKSPTIEISKIANLPSEFPTIDL